MFVYMYEYTRMSYNLDVLFKVAKRHTRYGKNLIITIIDFRPLVFQLGLIVSNEFEFIRDRVSLYEYAYFEISCVLKRTRNSFMTVNVFIDTITI